MVSIETLVRVLRDTFSSRNPGIVKLNKSALMLGYDYLQ